MALLATVQGLLPPGRTPLQIPVSVSPGPAPSDTQLATQLMCTGGQGRPLAALGGGSGSEAPGALPRAAARVDLCSAEENVGPVPEAGRNAWRGARTRYPLLSLLTCFLFNAVLRLKSQLVNMNFIIHCCSAQYQI